MVSDTAAPQLWANMFLSVASLIILMKLRFLYQELQRRIRRHANYVLVNETLEQRWAALPRGRQWLTPHSCAKKTLIGLT